MPIIKSKGIYYNVADEDVAAFEKEFGEGLRVPERLAGKTVDYKPSAPDNKWAVKVPKTPLPWEKGKDKSLLEGLAAYKEEQADKKERGEKAKQFQSKLGKVIQAVDYGKTTPTFEREKKTQTNQIKPQVFNVELPDGTRKWMAPDGSVHDDAILANMAAKSYVEEYNADDVLQPLQVRTEKRDGKDVPVYLLPTGEETDNVYYARALQKAYVGAVDKQRDTEKYMWELGVNPNQSPAQRLSIINDRIAKNYAAVKKYEKEHGSSYTQKVLLSLGMHSSNPVMGMLEAEQLYTNGYYDPKLKADEEYIRLRQEGENLFKAKLSVENELTDAGFLKGVGDAIVTSNAFSIAKPTHVTAQEAAFNIVDPESTVILQSAMQYDKNRGTWYNIGKIAGGSIVFGAEILADGGMGVASGAAKAVGKGVTKGLTKSLGKKAATVGGKVASGATGFGVSGLYNTIGTGSHRVLEDANEAMKGYVEVLGRGEFAQKDQTDAASAFGKAAARQAVEAGTEGIFAGGGLGLGKLLSSASRTKAGKFLGLSSIDKWLGYARSSQVGKMFNDIFKASGYHGLLEEGLEEEINIVLNSILVGDNQLSDLYDKKTQFELWAGMAASIGLMGALPGGMSIAQGAHNARKLKSAEKNLRSLLSPEYANTIIESIDNAYNSEFSNTLMGIIDNIGTHGNTMNQREAVMDYANAVLRARGYNNQRLADAESGELSVGDAITQAMMNTGATISEDQQKGIIDAYQRAGRELDKVLGLSNVEVEDIDAEGNYTTRTVTYEDVANNVDSGEWSYEQGVAAVKYLQAKAMRDGVMLSARDEISESVSRAKKKIADHTHTDGNIYEATDVLGRQVYIVSGNVATKEDGVIDDANSSKSLVVVNGETGAREMVPPSRIDKLGYVANAEEETARTEEEVGKAVTEAVANRLDGIQAGMLVEIPNENGESTPMEIVRTNGETILLMDGNGNTHEMSRNEVLSFISPNEISSPQADVDNSAATSAEEVSSPAPVERPKYIYKGKERTAYHLMPIEETLGEMYDELEMDSEAVNSVADANIAEVEEELEKHNKKEPKAPTLGADLGEYRDAIAKYKEVHAAWEAQAEEISKRKAYWEEVKASVAEFTQGESTQSELPYETPEMYIASQLGSIKITPNSFRRETGLGVEEQRKLVGIIATKEKGGVTIERASEMLSEDTHLEQLGMTDQTEIRDAIISILREGHPRGYAKRQVQSAETESEERLKDALANELGFASFDEYMEYEETVLPLVLSRYRGFNEEEYYNNLANNEYDTRRENTETPESDGVLFGEQPATADRIGDIEAERQGANVSAGVQGSAENAIASTEVDNSDINMVAPWGEYYAEESATRSPNVDNKIDELKAKERVGNAKKRATQKNFEKERSSAAKNIKKNEFIAKVLAKMLGVDVQIHTSKEDITSQNVLIAIDNVERNGGQVRGWYSNGVANIYLPHIFSVDDIVETIMHESVGHKSISDIFTEEERNTLYDNVWDSMSEQDQQKFLGYVKNENNQQDDVTLRRKAADEYVAHIAEKLIYGSRLNEKEKSVWKKIVEFFKYILGRRYAELDKEFYTTSGQMLSYEAIENLLIATHKAARKGGSMQNGSAESEGESFSFIGEKGATNLDKAEEATVRMDNLAIAREMEAQGKDALAIKMATGWERGADGKWRYEEMDVKAAQPREIMNGLRDGKSYSLSDVLTKDSYDRFISQYPEYADIKLEYDQQEEFGGGYWDKDSHTIAITKRGLNIGDEYLNRLLVHELQHAIQNAEGFAEGANPLIYRESEYPSEILHDLYLIRNRADKLLKEGVYKYFRSAAKNVLKEYVQRHWISESTINYFGLKDVEGDSDIDNLLDDLAFNSAEELNRLSIEDEPKAEWKYKRTAGEVEARNVSERMGKTMEERRASLRTETQDVADEDQIFIYEGLESASSEENIDAVNARFNAELDVYINGGAKANMMFHVGNPMGVMQIFLPNLPIVMRPRVINKATNTKHDVSVEALHDLPKRISAPIFVFQRDDNALGVLTEIKDNNGKNVCVAIELKKIIQDGGSYLEVNDIRSIHGRDIENLILPIIHNNTLKYVDKEKGLEWLSSASSNYQQEITKQDLVSATKVVENFENPQILGQENDEDTLFSYKPFGGNSGYVGYSMSNRAAQAREEGAQTMFSTINDVKHYASSVGSIAQEFGLRPSAMTNIIGSREELEQYKKFLDEEIYEMVVSAYNDKCTGYTLSGIRLVFIFRENLHDEHEGQITWWHEQTHCAYNNLTLQDKAELAQAALDWLEENSPSKYEVIKRYYKEEKQESEGVAVFIEEQIERHGIRNFIESDFADLGELAKLADVIRNAIKYGTEETNKQIEVYHRLRQPSTQPDSRGNRVIENSSNHERRVDGGTNSELKSTLRETSQRGGVLNPKASEDKAGNDSNASNDIRFSIANRNQVGFVSNAMKAVEGIKQEKATPSQWLAMIQKQGGLKAGEDKWLGLSEWLKGSDAKTLTKYEVLEFIGENMIQIEEVNYTEAADSFDELKEEYENLVREEGFDVAQDEMTNRFGDDFNIAFEDLGGELTIANEEAAAALLGSDNIIYGTRLDYTTEGLTNKREIALTVPTIESWNASDEVHFGDAGDGRAVAWIRFGETEDGEGNRVLVIDEIQSKRHQDGRERGYKDAKLAELDRKLNNNTRSTVEELDEASRLSKERYDYIINKIGGEAVALDNELTELQQKAKELGTGIRNEEAEKQQIANLEVELDGVRNVRDYDRITAEIEEIKERMAQRRTDFDSLSLRMREVNTRLDELINNYVREQRGGVEAAPFEKNWHELAMKRMLRLAAEEGYDKVAWTTGEQQADRYNIGGVVKDIDVADVSKGRFVYLSMNGGNIIKFIVNSEGTVIDGNSDYKGKQLADIVGKELSLRILNAENGTTLSGEDLRIGGEGMRGFYDKMLPAFMNKYGKKWGVKVGEITLPELEESAQKMWAVDVTPEMKESVMEGQTMFSAKRKAPETESVLEEEHQPSVVSSADGAKVLKDLDSLIKDYDENANKRPNTFLGDIAQALGATKHGSNSQYATFETMNGNIVTIRLSNHNARVSTFDNHNEQEGISIVVTAQDNNGVDNDGTAHVVEFFYDAIKLRKADGKPLVEILKSIKQSLYSGVYKDTTGLAEREEVNTMFSTVYHGSSSKFDKFDHSFMGTGEGHQAFGWGTYVSEVKGIAKTYAGISGQTMMTYKGQELDTESFDSPWRIIKDLYGESGGRLRDMRNRAERILGMVEEDNVDMKQLWQNVVDTLKKVRAGELKVKPIRQLYTVEIPDDNGSNYLYNEVDVPTNVKRDVKQRLYEVLAADDSYRGAERELRQELDHVFNLEQNGATLYGNVSAYLGSDKAASEFLNAMGFVGIKYPTNTLSGGNRDGSSNYVIFNDSDLKIEDRTMFSIVPASTIAQEWYDEAVRVEGGWIGFRNKVAESWFDDVRSVLKLQEAIEMQTGKPIRGMDNAYAQLIALSSKNHYDLQLLMDQNINPLTQFVDDMIRGKKMYGKKVRLEDVEKYLNAKHGLERNRVMARRDAEEQATREYKEDFDKLNEQLKADPENQSLKDRIDAMDAGRTSRIESETERIYQDIRVEKDYSGLTELFSDGNATLFDIEELAQEYVEDFENVMQGKTTDLWSKINEISKGTLKKQFLSGLISKADYDNIRNMYEYYVPLRGWKTDYAGDVYGYVTQSGKPNAIAPRPKRAKGRKSAATNIFGTLFNDANSAIVQGNKNMVKQALYRIAEKYGEETMLLQPSEVWATENSNGELVIEYPNFTPNASAETHMREYEEWLQRIQELEAEGRAKKITVKNVGKDFSLKMAKWQDQQHVIRVMNNGKEKMVYILGNPRAAQAINGLLNVSYNNGFVHMVSFLNSFMARVLTSLNPEFVVSNYERDVATVIANSYINKGAEYTAKVVKYAALHNPTITDPRSSIYTLMVKANKGMLDVGKEEERYFKEFVEQGGMTGVTTARTIEEYQRRMKRAVDKGNIPGKRLAETLLESIEFLNSCVENCNRFAVYRASRESGEEIQDAILDAKNSSLNFSRKGSGAMGNAAFRTTLLFVNPVMQALYMQRGWFVHHRARGIAVHGLLLATAIGSALMYSTMFGGDDDDEKKWYGLSEWNRYNYINIPAGDGWFHISIPQEFRAIWALGNVIIDLKNGVIDEQRAAKIMLSQINNYSPIALTNTKQFPTPDDSYLDVIIKGITPSIASPIADTFWNTNFYGNKIHNQTEHNQYAPEWKRVGRDTPQWVIDLAEKIDKATGGKENKKGILGKYSNPSKVYYVVSEYLGGTGKFLGKCWNLGEMLFSEKTFEDYKTYELPFVSKFWIEGNANANKARNIYSDYKAYEMEYKVIKWEIDKNRTERVMSMEEQIDRLAEMKESGELERYAVMKKYETAIDELYDKRKDLDGADNNDAVDRIDEEITNIRKSALAAMKSLDAGGNKEVQVEISYELAKDADKVYESKEKEKYRKDWLDIHKLLNKIRKYESEKRSVLEEDISQEAKDRKIKKKDEKIKNIKLKLHDIVLVKSTEELFNPYKDE